MTELSRRTAFTMLPMFLVAGFFLSACGSGGDGANGSTSSSGSPAPIVAQLVQQGYLKASNTNADDLFGSNVVLSNDTLVVGAPQEDSNASGVNGNQADNSAPTSGAVYVFVRSGRIWTQQAYLKASNTGAGDFFGLGCPRRRHAVVGAQEDSNATGVNGNQGNNSAANAGAAYVFTRSGRLDSAGLSQSLQYRGGRPLRLSVAVSGDTVVVGAYGRTATPPA